MIFSPQNKSEENYKTIVIKYDEKASARYSIKEYDKYPFLIKYISKNQLNDILDKANIIIFDSKLKKAQFDKVEISNLTYILIVIAFIFIIIYSFLFYYAPRTEKKHNVVKIFGIIFFSASILIMIIIEVMTIIQPIYGDKMLLHFYKDDLVKYLNKVNNFWEGTIIFTFDEKTNDLICKIKISDNNKMGNKKGSESSGHSYSRSDFQINSNTNTNTNSIGQSNKKSNNHIKSKSFFHNNIIHNKTSDNDTSSKDSKKIILDKDFVNTQSNINNI